MQLRYSFRIYPTAGQRFALARTFGCARTVFNDALQARRRAYAEGQPFPTSAALSKTLITLAKKTPERSWLANAPVGVLQQALSDLDRAYRNFFDSLAGKRKGPRVAAPRFKARRDNAQAARYTRSDRFKVLPNRCLRLPKVGEVRVRWTRSLPADPSSVTIIADAAGRYYASFVVDVDDEPLAPAGKSVGVDVGLGHFAVLSDGGKIDNPRFLRKAERRLKKRQRDLARKTKGSSNRAKARRLVARAHAQVRDARRDFLHKLSTRLVRENQAIAVEKLNIRGLARGRLGKSVHDAGWGMFLNMLEYKTARHARGFARVDPAYTSQTCSTCGVLDGPKPLPVRTWLCTVCSTEHDRDVNAAINVLTAAGRAVTACGARVRPGLVPAQREESGTHPGVYDVPATARVTDTAGICAL